MNGYKDTGLLYLCVHKKLCERINMSRIYSKKDFFRLLGETFHVPKKFRIIILKEMENKNLIKDLGNRKNNYIYVQNINFDFEENVGSFYQLFGLY